MRITELNNLADHHRWRGNNFAEELDQRLRSVTRADAEIRPDTETVFLPAVSHSDVTSVEMRNKPRVMRDVCVGTRRVKVEDRGVNTDVEVEVKPRLKERVKQELKGKEKPEMKEKVITKERGINTQIMGRIVAGNYAARLVYKLT